MPATYEPIASQTLGAGVGTVTFSTIAATWTDLVLVVVFGSATAGSTLRWRVNSDTGSNYSWTYLTGNGSAASSSRLASQTSGGIALSGLGGASTALDNIAIAHFMSYANTNVYKTVLGSGASAGREVDRSVSLWRSTSAITSISVSPGSSFPTYDFATGTTASLFGVKAA